MWRPLFLRLQLPSIPEVAVAACHAHITLILAGKDTYVIDHFGMNDEGCDHVIHYEERGFPVCDGDGWVQSIEGYCTWPKDDLEACDARHCQQHLASPAK